MYDHLTPDTSICATGACPAHIPVVPAASLDIDDVFIGDAQKQHTLRFRYRYTETPGSPPAMLSINLWYTRASGGIQNSAVESIVLVDSAGGWNTGTQDFAIGPIPDESITKILVRLWSDADDGIAGYLDLDGFELIDADTQENVFPVDVGSFTRDLKEATEKGDWPANVIDRLGGIASWGTASHHTSGALIGGGSFPGAFYAGRTLGEALVHANTAGPAGIIYGDPLYRASAAKLYAAGFVPGYQDDHIGDPAGYNVWSDTYQALDLRANVLHGTDNLDTMRWELSTCPELGIVVCDGNWTPRLQGVGAVEGLQLDGFETLIDIKQDQTVTMKLRVWNDGDEGNDLVNYADFAYWAHLRPDCPADINADGVVDQLDVDLVELYWDTGGLCPVPYKDCTVDENTGFCVFDFDQDGDVDEDDHTALVNLYWGPCPL